MPDPDVAAAAKRLQRIGREAARIGRLLADASVASADVYGRLVVPAGEPPSAEDVLGFLDMARSEYPGRDLTLIVVAPVAQGGSDERERAARGGSAGNGRARLPAR